MTAPSTEAIIGEFTQRVQAHLDPERIDGPVRLDNTRTVVIIPVAGKSPIHAHLRRGLGDEGVEDVIAQIRLVPSLQNLLKAH